MSCLLRRNSVKLISAKENISDGPEGIILESMLEGYAEYYSAELMEKIHRGQRDKEIERIAQRLAFAKSIYLFDDRAVFTYNYRSRTQTISLAQIAACGSDFDDGPSA